MGGWLTGFLRLNKNSNELPTYNFDDYDGLIWLRDLITYIGCDDCVSQISAFTSTFGNKKEDINYRLFKLHFEIPDNILLVKQLQQCTTTSSDQLSFLLKSDLTKYNNLEFTHMIGILSIKAFSSNVFQGLINMELITTNRLISKGKDRMLFDCGREKIIGLSNSHSESLNAKERLRYRRLGHISPKEQNEKNDDINSLQKKISNMGTVLKFKAISNDLNAQRLFGVESAPRLM